MSADSGAEPPSAGGAPPSRWSRRRVASLLLKIAVLVALAAWVATGDAADQLVETLRELPPGPLALAFAVGLLTLSFGGVRWRLIMQAFGGRPLPPTQVLIRAYFVGQFYNSFVPGSIGGDIVRGVVSRGVFDSVSRSVMVVFLERFVGLASLIGVFAIGLYLGPELPGIGAYGPYVFTAGAVGGVAVVGLGVAGRVTRSLNGVPVVGAVVRFGAALIARLEARLGIELRLADLEHVPPLLWAALLAMAMHACGIAIFAVLSAALGFPIELLALLQIVPLAIIASMLPIAVAGLGPREAALVVMLGPLGISEGQALALSLSYWAVLMGLALIGGLIQLVWGIDLTPTESGADASGSTPGVD